MKNIVGKKEVLHDIGLETDNGLVTEWIWNCVEKIVENHPHAGIYRRTIVTVIVPVLEENETSRFTSAKGGESRKVMMWGFPVHFEKS